VRDGHIVGVESGAAPAPADCQVVHRPGPAADLLIVDGDPLTDPTALRDVRTVVARGRVTVTAQPTWHTHGMNRIRLSTTVDAHLLGSARSARSGITDAALIDEALRALLARHRSAEVDASYTAYDEHPIDEPDEWGELASWRRAAGAS
jgi:hypothetical protein